MNENKSCCNISNIIGRNILKKAQVSKHLANESIFYNNSEVLLKKLQIIVGEIMAGNTSIEIRNMGVSILDSLYGIIKSTNYNIGKLLKNIFLKIYIWNDT